MSVFMLPAAPGHCQVCCVKHDPDQPHNQQSLPYQMWFQATYGRAPTWADATAHCPAEVRKQWRRLLKLRGAWSEPGSGDAIATVDSSGGKPIPRPLPGLEPKIVKMGRRKK